MLMKKIMLSLIWIVLINEIVFAQPVTTQVIDSMLFAIRQAPDDIARVNLATSFSWRTLFSRPDSTLSMLQQALQTARSIEYKRGQISCEIMIANVWWTVGDYQKSIDILLKNETVARSMNDKDLIEGSVEGLQRSYRDQGNYMEALKYCKELQKIESQAWRVEIGAIYRHIDKPDSALYYLLPVHNLNDGFMGFAHLEIGRAYFAKENYELALNHFRTSAVLLYRWGNTKDLSGAFNGSATVYQKKGNIDSAIFYVKKSLELASNALFKKEYYQSCRLMSSILEKNNPGESIYYLKQAVAAKDSMFNIQKILGSVNDRFNEQFRQQETQKEKSAYQAKIKTLALLSGLLVFLVISILLYRNNRHKQDAKIKIETAYNELKSTQAQLIQSEKMASLGELTAGIAHEIQNPLNFVNNFSEVNTELIQELKSELQAGNHADAIAIANDIADNEQKISHHGKRADAIVKGMLQHSRSSTNIKELTDINALADEYLRLAYHGMRAKDNSFNALMKTDFDETIEKINIIPQDMGRVILNLITNAFYAVTEKKKQEPNGYEPLVTVSTKKIDGKVEIKVSDNGNGIPQKVLDKIFQPFFTTKPTGQGTGLGLSLSYDIVKAHGGEIKVETKEGQGTEFMVFFKNN